MGHGLPLRNSQIFLTGYVMDVQFCMTKHDNACGDVLCELTGKAGRSTITEQEGLNQDQGLEGQLEEGVQGGRVTLKTPSTLYGKATNVEAS